MRYCAIPHTQPMNERIEQVVGRRIRELRESQQLSKVDFCLMVGVSRPYLDRIESGNSNITIKMLAALAAGLGVQPEDLLR